MQNMQIYTHKKMHYTKKQNALYKKKQIFRRQFLYQNLLLSWQETVENFLPRPENPLPKKKRQSEKM